MWSIDILTEEIGAWNPIEIVSKKTSLKKKKEILSLLGTEIKYFVVTYNCLSPRWKTSRDFVCTRISEGNPEVLWNNFFIVPFPYTFCPHWTIFWLHNNNYCKKRKKPHWIKSIRSLLCTESKMFNTVLKCITILNIFVKRNNVITLSFGFLRWALYH